MLIHDTATIGPGKPVAEFHFSGRSGTAKSHLVEEAEGPLVASIVHVDAVRQFILQQLGLIDRPAWILLGAPRNLVIPQRPAGKPGDFDLICGPVAGGALRFDYLADAEVKIRRLDADGDLRSSGSGQGTAQARGAAELGFDRTLLLHLMVSASGELPPGRVPTWDTYAGPSFSAVETAANQARRWEGASPAYGLALLGLGEITGTDFHLAGSISPVAVRAPPFRPLHDQTAVRTARQHVERALEAHFGSSRPASWLFAHCRRCRQLFTPKSPSDMRCC